MKKIKLCLIAFFAIVFASMSCAFVATSVKHAEAATKDEVSVLKSGVFAMDDSGLTLRTNDNVGIRFKVKMSKNLGVKIKGIEDVSLKFLIAPRVVVDSVNGDYSKLVTAAEKATEGKVPARIFVADKNKMYENGGYYWASLVIANTTGSNIELDMNVVAYITYTDENKAAQTRYATTNVEKVRGNLYNVVNSCAVINNEYAKDIIENKNFDWYGTETYPIKIATTKQANVLTSSGVKLSGKTVLSSVDFTGTEATVKTVTESFVDENRQEIVLGGDNDTYAIDGMGVYDGTVEKTTIGGVVVDYDNKGNVTLSSEFKNRLAKHGEQILSVTVKGADGNYTEYKKKLLVVTKEISSFEELKAALAFDSNNVKYGYYRLATNLIGYGGYESGNGIGGGIWKNESGDTGFRGTFDGNGFTIQETFWNTGLFGYIGKGAVIKNITLTQNEYVGGRMILGYSMVGAKLENVKINVKGKGATAIPTTTTSDGKTVGVAGGLLTAIFAHSNDFENVVVDAKDTDVDTLFGSCVYYGYPTGYEANRFTNCDVIAKSIIGLACTDNAEGIKGNASAFILSADNLSVGIISRTPWVDTVDIVLSPNQKTYTVNLKSEYEDYTNATVLSAIWGEEAVTYENGKLTFTDEIITNKQKHGSKTLSVLLKQRGMYYNVKAQVIVITKEINSAEDWSVLASDKYTDKKLYGYYRLGSDIKGAAWLTGGVEYYGSFGEEGFKGTLDGNGHTIDVVPYNTGLLGDVGSGAVIKNINIISRKYDTSYNKIIGRRMWGATLDNVTITVSSTCTGTDPKTAYGLITGLYCYSTTFNNVTIDVGTKFASLIGASCDSIYAYPNTFKGCTLSYKDDNSLGLYANWKKEDKTLASSYPLSLVSGITVSKKV